MLTTVPWARASLMPRLPACATPGEAVLRTYASIHKHYRITNKPEYDRTRSRSPSYKFSVFSARFHYFDNDIIWHGSSYHRWENKIFDIETYNLHGVDVYGPKDSNLYLTENYGEWKTPVTDFHFNTGTPNLSIVKNPSSIAMFIKRISEFRSRKSFLKNEDILQKLNILSEKGVFDIRGIQN